MSYTGRVESVYRALAGGVMSADAGVGSTVLSVDFPVDFDEQGGTFTRVPLDETATDPNVYAYDAVDVDAGTVTLVSTGPSVSNFLTGDNTAFTSTKGNWAQLAGTVAWVSGQSEDGDNGALQLTSSSGGAAPTAGSCSNANYATQAMTCAPGDTIYVSGWFKAATVGRVSVVGATFFTSSGTVIGGGATFGTGVTSNTTGWVHVTATLTAPATAAFVRAQVQVQGTGNSEDHYFDNAWMSNGVVSGLPVAFAAGDLLHIEPQSSDARALVRLADSTDEAAVDCRVSHALRALLPVGARDPGTGESVVVDETADGLAVTDLVGQDPIIVGARFVATGDAGEMLIYSGQPTLGNLVSSVSAVDGVDGEGNYYLAGNVSYSFDVANSLYVAAQVNAGTVAFYTATTMQEQPSSPWTAGPKVDGWSVQTGMLAVTGPVGFTQPFQVLDPTTFALETWHDLGSPSITGVSWTNHRYRLTPDGEIEFDFVGAATANITASAATFANTMPAAYRPITQREYVVGCGPSGFGRMLIHTDGTILFTYPAMTNGNVIGAGFHMPKD